MPTQQEPGTQLSYAAGYSLTSGTKNVLIGKDAGFQLSSANYNTFVGYEAGMNSNQSQTLVGYEAGKGNTNGYENTLLFVVKTTPILMVFLVDAGFAIHQVIIIHL